MPDDLTISALPVDPNVTGSELVPIVDPGATPKNRNATIQSILALVTKISLGLGSVNNTSDLNKPISMATAAALVGKAAAGPIGDSGLTMTAGLLGRGSGTGAPLVLTLGSGLSIVDGVLTVTGGGGGYPSLAMPTGFSVAGNGTASLTVTYATGYSLPTNTSQTSWNAAAVLAATSVQEGDPRLSDAREWSATTVSEADAVAGISTVRRAWTVLRVWQAAEAWWQSFSGATGRAVAAAGTQAQGRTALGLGSASQRDAGTAAGNVPVLDGSGLVPSALLPGFVDDVLEFASIAAFPAAGEAGKLYISLATNRQYRWSGSVYVEINPSPGSTDGVPEGSVNLYFTTARGQSAASSWWSSYRSAIGDQLATAASQGAARSAIAAGTSSLVVSSNAPAALGATAAAGSTGQAADAGHVHQRDTDVIVIPVGDETTALTAGTNKVRFRMPFPATLLAVRDGVNLAPTGSPLIVDINEAGTSVLGTKLSIDATETSSTTAAGAATITDPSLADDAEISIDIDQVGSTVAGAGLKVYLFVRRA